MERHVPTDLPGVEPGGHRAPIGKRVAPYLLGGPAALWLVIFFVVPLFTLLSLSLQTCATTRSRSRWFVRFWSAMDASTSWLTMPA